MREKIERLAKGIFEYKMPDISLSEENIAIFVEAGKTYHGNFIIKNDENSHMKGVVYSSDKRFEIKNNNFLGNENTIEYEFRADYLSAGELIKGEISIISNCGEKQIPFTCEIELPYCITSLGKIKDLFEFTNLAKADWAEALKLFRSEEFKRVFLYKDRKNQMLYQSLMKSRSLSQALEEFLVTIHKKIKINLSVNKINLNCEAANESIMDSILITKDNWGYEEIRINTDSNFIELDHKIIWSDNFLGSNYILEVVLNPKYMRNGNNFGRIYLKTVHQTITIEVFCKCNKDHLLKNPNYHKIKLYRQKLTLNYLKFRKNYICLEKYMKDTTDLIQNLCVLDQNNFYYDLIRTHLYIISGNDEKVQYELTSYSEKINELKENNILFYCGYLYLNALFCKEDNVTREAVTTISNYYENEYHKFDILWFLLYLDINYDKNKNLKFAELRKQFEAGCKSPILYYEAYSVLKEEPSLLHELGSFEIQLINWSVKNLTVSKDVAMQFTYLANREKRFNRIIYNSLVKLYEENENPEILSALCSILIKGHKNANKYFKWYSLGVNAQLRITELHEYYMYSLDESHDISLAQPILLYFMYNSSLGDRKKAYLYSSIIKNKKSNPDMYQSYVKQIKQFAYKQLQQHNINNSLAIIYEDILKKDKINEENSEYLSYLIFQYEISCLNPNIKGVYIIHKELQEEIFVPLIEGHAKFNIFTEDAGVYLVDMHDNRYITTVDYTLNKLMHIDEYINKCYEFNPCNTMLLLNRLDKAQDYQKEDTDFVQIRNRALQIQDLREYQRRSYIRNLIYYYYDNFEGELLEAYLIQIDLSKLTNAERNKIIEYMIKRDLYEKAYEAIQEFGYEGIAVKRLVKLCSRLIKETEENENDFLVSFASYVFFTGKYDDTILKYLIKYYSTTTKDMFALFQAAKQFELDTEELEERLLGQMLFTENLSNSIGVFMSYYKKESNHKLMKAYLSYHSYIYLVKDIAIDEELFDFIKKEVVYEENEICMLALLKFYSTKKELSEEDCDFTVFNLNKFIEKGIILPFFKNFKNKISIPDSICNKYYVEYKTNPKNKVVIHYIVDSEDNNVNRNNNVNRDNNVNKENNYISKGKEIDLDAYQSEIIQDVYQGIYVKEFVLFYNENLKYYITEINGEEEHTTECFDIKLDDSLVDEEEETKYNQINLMLIAKEIGDDKTLLDMMEQFIKQKYLASEIFKPI